MDPNIPVLNLDPDPGPRDLKTSFVCSKSEAILEKMLIFIKGEGSGEFLSNIIRYSVRGLGIFVFNIVVWVRIHKFAEY